MQVSNSFDCSQDTPFGRCSLGIPILVALRGRSPLFPALGEKDDEDADDVGPEHGHDVGLSRRRQVLNQEKMDVLHR